MNIILITHRGKTPRTVQCSSVWHYTLMIGMLLTVLGMLFYTGFYFGANKDPEAYVKAWQGELDYQKQALSDLKTNSQAHIDALTARIGQQQGHITRLDALGSKLVKMAKLQENEFDFNNPPALGGPEEQQDGVSFDIPDLEQAIISLNHQLSYREHQLMVLEDVLRNRNLHEEIYPAGRPIKKGWISSTFGYRNSPFGGKRMFHKGIDIADKEGSEIIAVAGGVVTWAGKRYDYGNFVEINHGNGYITRYAHNKELKVRMGEAVKKGQIIALMGSTGRSTGAHVHFEVLKNGKPVDPIKFIQAVN